MTRGEYPQEQVIYCVRSYNRTRGEYPQESMDLFIW